MDPKTDAHLWRALALGSPARGSPPVVAVVGGGGKTTLVYRLAAEAAAMGRRAVVTGTTRFTRPEPPTSAPPVVQAPPQELPARIVAAWAADGASAAARCLVAAGDEEQPAGRLAPVPPEIIARMRRLPGLGLIAVEADGSKMRPFKAPAAHEPVIPPVATHVVAVVGADAVGAALTDRLVHRPDCVRLILGRADGDEAPLTATEIAAVVADREGGRKEAGTRPFIAIVNKADAHPDAAHALGAALRAAGVPRVLITSLRRADRPVDATLHDHR